LKKVVLAYSGGLDTSVAIKWLQEKYGYRVIALAVDVGEGKDLEFTREKALQIGAEKSYVLDARQEYLRDYAFKALKANALYEGKYPLASALSRPLISKLLVDIARKEGAEAVAHGCTGKGNDQVRFDVSVGALAPDLKIIAPVREWPMSREEEIDYALERGIPIPVGKANPFSIDENLWGRSIECGVLEDPWTEPPAEAYEWTTPVAEAPAEPEYLELTFEGGVPTGIGDVKCDPVELVSYLNKVGGKHGVGRLDHVENRLVGIKSREVYEAPAASILISAHKELENLTLAREVAHFLPVISQKYAELTYYGLWFSPLREALDAFLETTQEAVSGRVRVKLHKGSCSVVGRKSPHSLYDYALATYDQDDTYNHAAAEGFIELWGLPTRVYASAHKGPKALKAKRNLG